MPARPEPSEAKGRASARPKASSIIVDRILVCEAFPRAASQFHGGQSSKGSAKLCQLDRMGFRPGLGNAWRQRGIEERDAAA
jgi:hypothetical protein